MKNTIQILIFSFFFFLIYIPNSLAISREVDLNSKEIKDSVKLDGAWEFYPNQFLSFQDFQERSETLEKSKVIRQVPESIIGIFDLFKKPLHYGTYRLKIVFRSFSSLNQFEYINFYIPGIQASYNLFINDQLYIQNGKVSTQPSQSRTSNLKRILTISKSDVFSHIGPSFDLILHVNGSPHLRHKISQPIYFSLSKHLPVLYEIEELLFILFLFIPIVAVLIALTCSFFANLLYFQYPKINKSIVYLFFINILILCSGLFSLSLESYYFPFLFKASFLEVKGLELGVLISIFILYLWFFNHFFEQTASKKRILQITIASLVIVIISDFSTHFLQFISPESFFLFFYLILFTLSYFLVKNAYISTFKTKFPSSGWLFLSSIFIFLALLIDAIWNVYRPVFFLQPSFFFLFPSYILGFLIINKLFRSVKFSYTKRIKTTINLNSNFLPAPLLDKDTEKFPNIQYTRTLAGVLFCIDLAKRDSDKENDSFLFSGLEIVFDIIQRQKGQVLKTASNYFLFVFFESWENAIHSSIFIQRELSRSKSVYQKKIKVSIGMEYFKSGLILNYVGSPENLSLNLFSLSFLKSVKKIYQKGKDSDLKVVIGPELFKFSNLDVSQINPIFYREKGTFFTAIPFLRTTMPVTGDRVNLYELSFAINGDIVMRNKATVAFYYHEAYKLLMNGDVSQAFFIYRNLRSFNPDDKSLDTFLKFSLDCLREPTKLYNWI